MKLKEKIIKICSGALLSAMIFATPVLAAEDFDRISEGYMSSNNITLKISGHHEKYDAYVAYYYNGK